MLILSDWRWQCGHQVRCDAQGLNVFVVSLTGCTLAYEPMSMVQMRSEKVSFRVTCMQAVTTRLVPIAHRHGQRSAGHRQHIEAMCLACQCHRMADTSLRGGVKHH